MLKSLSQQFKSGDVTLSCCNLLVNCSNASSSQASSLNCAVVCDLRSRAVNQKRQRDCPNLG